MSETATPGEIPVCAWVRMDMQGFADDFIGFTYVDPQAGLSAKGSDKDDKDLVEKPSMTVRLSIPGPPCTPLSAAEISQLKLPAMPSWVETFYGPQPLAGKVWGTWRRHPQLAGRIHPQFPDDLQVIVHDGGPRLTQRRPELIWVRVTGDEQDVFVGRLLNRPHQLITVSEGDQIQFVIPPKSQHPLMVTSKYLSERGDWVIHPCNKCGLTELFDAPSDLLKVIFPNAPADKMAAFSSFCVACGGAQVVERKGPREDAATAMPGREATKWWQIWR